jgi:hypothetical protein
MAKVINLNADVIVPEFGRHFHLFADCRALAQGWANTEKAGHATWVPATATYAEAVDDNKFGCEICHKVAGVEVPVVASLKHFRAANAAKRAARKAQTDAANALKVAAEAQAFAEVLAAEAARLADAAAQTAELAAV